MQTKKGQSIEDASMQVIEREIGSHSYNKKEWPIVRRVIHSTADFDFARENAIVFHKDAIESGLNALKAGCSIVVDVNGVTGLLNKQHSINNDKDDQTMKQTKLALSAVMIVAVGLIGTNFVTGSEMTELETFGRVVRIWSGLILWAGSQRRLRTPYQARC